MTRIPIDLNAISADGYYRVSLSRFEHIPKVGDPVTVFEDQDCLEGIAEIADVTYNFVYIKIDLDKIDSTED